MSDSVLERIRTFFVELGAVDTIALALLLLFLIRGAVKGLVWQVAGLAGVVGGLVVARTFALDVAPKITKVIPRLSEEQGLDIYTAYFLLFVGTLVVAAVLGRLLKNLIDRLRLQSFDRVLGGVFGMVKAAALIVMAVYILAVVPSPMVRTRIAEARTGKFALEAMDKGQALFPESVRQYLSDTMEKVRGHLESEGAGSNADTSGTDPRPR